MKNILKRSGLVALVAALLLPLFLGAFPQKASAAIYATDNTKDRAEAWVLARALSECIAEKGLASPVQEAAAKEGSWLWGGNVQIGEFAADLVEGGKTTSSDDDKSACDGDRVTSKALATLGFKYAEVLCAIGYSREVGDCVDGSGDFKLRNGVNYKSTDKWNDYVRSKYLGGKSLSDAVTPAMKYFIYFNEFQTECGNGKGGGWKRVDWKDSHDTSSNKAYRLPWLMADGTVKDSYVTTSGNDEGHDVHISGYKMIDEAGDRNNDVMSCGDLANKIRQYAPAFQTALDKEDTLASDLEGNGLSTDGQKDDECLEGVGNANPLSWLGCAVLTILDSVLNWADSTIHQLLFVEKDITEQVKGSWTIFRNLAYIVLVPLMLLMVIGTAIGSGLFDAYTVKKALPRMVAAVIFITLSFPICEFLINVSNLVGNGAGNLITSFVPEGGSTFDGIDGAGGTAGSIIALGSLYALAGSVTWGIVGSLGLVMVVGMLIAFFVLVIRQILIVMLVVLAPLAILVWIFPGNDKLWGIWKTTFIAMLMMYPLISILIASGKFFAGIAKSAGVGGDAAGTLIAMIAYVAPFFLIPATFKYGLGIFGNIAGMVNDRSRGFFDKQRKYREGARATGRHKALTGNRFAGGTEGNFRGRLNKGVAGTMNAPRAISERGATFKPSTWGSATSAAMSATTLAEIERNMKENKAYQPWMFDDGLNRAASESRNEDELRKNLIKSGYAPAGSRELEAAVAKVEPVRRSMNPEAFKAMTTRQAVAGGTAFSSSKEEGAAKTAAGEVWASVARASANDDSLAQYLVANGRSEGVKAGRLDYAAAGFGTTLGVVNKMREEFRETGTISQASIEEATRKIHADVYSSQGGASLVHASVKPSSVEEMVPEILSDVDIARTVKTGNSDEDARQFTQSLASLAAVYDGMQGSSPAKAKIMADRVFSRTFDVASLSPEMIARLQPVLRQPDGTIKSTGTITYQQAIDALRGNNEFKEMRREYASEVDRMLGQPPIEPEKS